MGMVKDRSNFPVKLASERALLHVLQIHTQPNVLSQYASTLDAANSRALLDYGKRVLAKLQEESESDSEASAEQDAESTTSQSSSFVSSSSSPSSSTST